MEMDKDVYKKKIEFLPYFTDITLNFMCTKYNSMYWLLEYKLA